MNEKTVSLCIRCGKVTANLLKAAMVKALAKMEQEKKQQGQKQPQKEKEDKTYKGKQSLAGMIITFVLCYELISMLTEKNNMHDIDTWMFFKYFFKMWVAVWIVSHTFTITMAVFDVGQSVVSRAAGVISSDTTINIDTMISTMETAMESMEIGELVILALETMLVSLCMKIISVFITVILYGRMIEIYLYSSVGAIPFATMSNREWGQIGNNYLRGLFALAFQGFFMMVCVGIYAVLVANIQMSDNIHSALFGVMAYTVILCFSLMKTGNFARSIFNAH